MAAPDAPWVVLIDAKDRPRMARRTTDGARWSIENWWGYYPTWDEATCARRGLEVVAYLTPEGKRVEI